MSADTELLYMEEIMNKVVDSAGSTAYSVPDGTYTVVDHKSPNADNAGDTTEERRPQTVSI